MKEVVGPLTRVRPYYCFRGAERMLYRRDTAFTKPAVPEHCIKMP